MDGLVQRMSHLEEGEKHAKDTETSSLLSIDKRLTEVEALLSKNLHPDKNVDSLSNEIANSTAFTRRVKQLYETRIRRVHGHLSSLGKDVETLKRSTAGDARREMK